MQDEVRDCSCCNNCNQGGLFGNLFEDVIMTAQYYFL